jgi:hypothetical protein
MGPTVPSRVRIPPSPLAGGPDGRPAVARLASGAAPVAQLDRASVYGTEGHRFESCRARCGTPAFAAVFCSRLPRERFVVVSWATKRATARAEAPFEQGFVAPYGRRAGLAGLCWTALAGSPSLDDYEGYRHKGREHEDLARRQTPSSRTAAPPWTPWSPNPADSVRRPCRGTLVDRLFVGDNPGLRQLPWRDQPHAHQPGPCDSDRRAHLQQVASAAVRGLGQLIAGGLDRRARHPGLGRPLKLAPPRRGNSFPPVSIYTAERVLMRPRLLPHNRPPLKAHTEWKARWVLSMTFPRDGWRWPNMRW